MHQHRTNEATGSDRDILPGLGKGFLTRLYDPVTRVIATFDRVLSAFMFHPSRTTTTDGYPRS